MSALLKPLQDSKIIRVASVKKISYFGEINQKRLMAYLAGALLVIGVASAKNANAATYESLKNLSSQTATNPGSISQYLKRTSKVEQLPINDENVVPEKDKYVVYVLETKAPKSRDDASYFYPLYLD